MTNTSATGGFIVPNPAPDPLEGTALLDAFQETFSGVTGLASDFVRPAYQSEDPNYPAKGIPWLAFAITDRKGDIFPVIQHDGTGDGQDNYQQQEELIILCSFYDDGSGSSALGNAARLRDGLKIPQNMEALGANQIALRWAGYIQPVPSLLKQLWNYRCDLELHFNRQISRSYPILNLVEAAVTITSVDPDRVTDILIVEQ